MKKGLLFIAISIILGTFTACNNTSETSSEASLIGTWVMPASENDLSGDVGFTLQKDGVYLPVNSPLPYNIWKQEGDLLIIGTATDGQVIVDADSLWIDELTMDHLTVKDFGNNKATFLRKNN